MVILLPRGVHDPYGYDNQTQTIPTHPHPVTQYHHGTTTILPVMAGSSSTSLRVLGAEEELDSATSSCFHGGGAGFWPAAEKVRSTLTSEADLRRKCANYKLPEVYTVLCANDWAPCRAPPEGSNIVCIYESMLEAGIRLPLHEFYAKILRHCNLAPSQLCPNAWRYLAGFVLLCKDAEVEPTKALFRHFFKLCAHGGEQQGWYHFGHCSNKRVLFKSAGSSLPSNDGWRKRFFFIDTGSADMPWRCPKKWGTPGAKAFGKPKEVVRTVDASEAISKLEEVAKKNASLMELLCMSKNQHKLPVLRPPVKTEATDAGSEFRSSAPRKRKALRDILAAPPQQMAISGTSSPPDRELSSTRLVCQLMQKTEADLSQTKEQLRKEREEHAADVARLEEELSAAKAEHAANAFLLKQELSAAKEEHAADVAQFREKLEAEKAKHMAKISVFEEELKGTAACLANTIGAVEAERGNVRQLMEKLQARNDEHASAIGVESAEKQVLWAAQSQHTARVQQLQAAEAERAAKVCELTGLLQAAEAEVGQLKQQLAAERALRADEVSAIKTEYQNKVIDAEHRSSKLIGEMLGEMYGAGLRRMNEMYPGSVHPTRLTPEALVCSVLQGFRHAHPAPADQ